MNSKTPTQLPAHLARMLGDKDDLGSDSLEQLFHQVGAPTHQQNPVTGHITKIEDSKVWVDVQLKSDGVIDLIEFRNDGELAVNQDVEVWVKNRDGPGGHVLLSREAVIRYRVWDQLLELHKKGEPVPGKVIRKDRASNRYLVDIMGVCALLPFDACHSRLPGFGDAESGKGALNIGDEDSFIISRIDNVEMSSARVFLTRRSGLLDSEHIREQVENKVFSGKISGLSDAGAYVSMEIESRVFVGWLPRANMCIGALHAKDVFSKGDPCEVRVLRVCDFGEVQLTMVHNIWEGVPERFQQGSLCQVRVIGSIDGSVLVALPDANGVLPDLSGLSSVPASAQRVLCATVGVDDMCGIRGKAIDELFRRGDCVEIAIKEVDMTNMVVHATISGTSTDPWKSLEIKPGDVNKYRVAKVIDGKVYAKAFFDITSCITGVLKLNMYQMWQIPRAQEELEMTVVECDAGKGRVLLARGVQDIVKQTELIAGLSQGAQVSVEVRHVVSSGVRGLSVMYKGHLEGFIRADDIARSKSLEDYKPGDTVTAIVKSIGHNYKENKPEERFVVLSILAAEKRISREAHPVRKATFGSMVNDVSK